VSFKRCLAAVRLADPALGPLVDQRIARLREFYGAAEASVVRLGDGMLVIVAIGIGGNAPASQAPWVWGGPLPSEPRSAADLISASDDRLRRLETVLAVVAWSEREVLIVGGAGGVASLYTAEGDGIEVWATHAVAAGLLARDRAGLDSSAIPELVAREYVGGDRTLVAGVRALPVATRVALTAAGSEERSYWPARERWAPVPQEDAQAYTEDALLRSLAARVDGSPSPQVALTGGLDSRVVAVALRELGIEFGAFTWGDPGWADAEQAAPIAATLGASHDVLPIEWRDDADALRLVDPEARWTDGTTPVRFAAPRWPGDVNPALTGMGGETGRAFYYRADDVRKQPRPALDDLHRFFHGRGRLRLAGPHAIETLRSSERAWLEDAHAAGASGWRALDVLYAEQRVRRWGRAMMPLLDAPLVAAFAAPAVSRGLASLPIEERLTSGFHRRFLTRVPEIAAPTQPPPDLRRSHARRARGVVAGVPGARRLAGIVRGARRGRPPFDPWYAADGWPERPRLRTWLREEVLASPLLADALGDRWLDDLGERFDRDESLATETALLVAAPVALDRALRAT
jgi:hypothetical protein